MTTSTPAPARYNRPVEMTIPVPHPELGHNGKNIVIILPGNECIPVISTRVREAKIALSRIQARGPRPEWSADQRANHDWQLRSARDTLRDAIYDVMREYGIEFVDGVPTVRHTRWISTPVAA